MPAKVTLYYYKYITSAGKNKGTKAGKRQTLRVGCSKQY
jgi:hypothetical protein